ncbi:HAD family hydrolase [Veronia pacifica]|uniref:Beta-phosphoglucomutase n=1 Tax=Veronia pacifica TaxID=1080227 RepID=A0A1C3EBW9_9GAMM|nr:HAD family phosphatase [Veronia pacifica]ODA30690.1 beta-phosphoglucomutase [Veronia pacifica]
MKSYKAYLFDLDGTLVNSEPLKGKAIAMACRDLGGDVNFNHYKTVMGQDWPTVTGHFFRLGNISPTMEMFNMHFRTHYEALLAEKLSLNPGVEAFLSHIKANNSRCAVVSSAAAWMVDRILTQLQMTQCFDLVISADDVKKHKPHPEAYLIALSKYGVTASDALIFEDSQAGLEAGKAAGCDVVAIQHGFNIENDLSSASSVVSDFTSLINR